MEDAEFLGHHKEFQWDDSITKEWSGEHLLTCQPSGPIRNTHKKKIFGQTFDWSEHSWKMIKNLPKRKQHKNQEKSGAKLRQIEFDNPKREQPVLGEALRPTALHAHWCVAWKSRAAYGEHFPPPAALRFVPVRKECVSHINRVDSTERRWSLIALQHQKTTTEGLLGLMFKSTTLATTKK